MSLLCFSCAYWLHFYKMMYDHIHCTKSASFQSLPLVYPLSLSLCIIHVQQHDIIGCQNCLHWYLSELTIGIPPKRSKTFDEEYAGCNTQKVTKRSMRQCWLRDVGLQINTKTNRSRAGEFRKFVLRCSVLVPNSWMWTSDYTVVRCFCISQHPQHAFLLDEAPLLLWQSVIFLTGPPLNLLIIGQ